MIDIDKIRRSAGIIGESDQIQEMLALIGQVANTDISVLISGESGSGKELVAKAVHFSGKFYRKDIGLRGIQILNKGAQL